MTSKVVINTQSNEYLALLAAANGEVQKLKNFDFKILNELTAVQLDPLKKFTPLHYALFKEKWEAVAFLINAGCAAKISSIEAKPRTALSMLTRDEKSLHNLFSAFIHLDLPWNLDAIVPLITHNDLILQRRFVLKDQDLLMRIGSHGRKTEALVMVTSIMVGSFQWNGYDTDFVPWLLNNVPLPINGSISCSQLLAYAAYFCGVSKNALDAPQVEVDMEQVEKDRAQMASGKPPMESMKSGSQIFAKHMGLPLNEKERVLLSLRNPAKEKIRVFYVDVDGHIAHYGLHIQLNGGSYAIHIDPEVKDNYQVAIDRADDAFAGYRSLCAKIYLSMLPWINETNN